MKTYLFLLIPSGLNISNLSLGAKTWPVGRVTAENESAARAEIPHGFNGVFYCQRKPSF